MNLLAHAVLSPDNTTIQVGNVLADFIRRGEIEGLNPEILQGIELHKRIDRYTDNHPLVERSHQKLIGFKRFGNPLVDVFYDHFLTIHWQLPIPISEYILALYRTILEHRALLPKNCVQIAERMIEQDWMSQYGTFEGLKTNLSRMESRIEWATGRKVDLVSSIQILEVRYEEFEADFLEFWPQLVKSINEN